MTDNLTGIQANENDRKDWSPAGNSGFSEGENALTNYSETTQEVVSPAGAANEYTDKLAGVVTQAKDFLGEKVGAVGGKIKEFATDDLSGMANKAKDFARQNPGQAILVSAAAGLLLGLFVRARR
ncbi:MAG TPA: hypothetical protein VFX97_14330 [Pyrinomonadaceae bacterium]|nr:hypothetical protein [Pyrinomonadaceae bacterium]